MDQGGRVAVAAVWQAFASLACTGLMPSSSGSDRGETEHRCGSARFVVSKGAIGPIWIGEREIVRRIFVTARDSAWAETPPVIWGIEELSVTMVSVHARHSGMGVDVEWQGQFEIAPATGEINFRFRGQALADTTVCRLGLVVLLPVELMTDATIETLGTAGDMALPLSVELAPQPIIDGLPSGMTEPFSEIRVLKADGRELSLDFSGDLFELEDQRNWGDASFKIYCTPLREGFPKPVVKGTVIEHAVRIRYRVGDGVEPSGAPLEPRIVPNGNRRPFPELGITGPTPQLGFDIGYSHLALNLDSDEISDVLDGMHGGDFSYRIDLGLTPACLTTGRPKLERLLRAYGQSLARVRLYGENVSLPTSAHVALLRGHLAAGGAHNVPVFAATRGYFVEFNRAQIFDLSVDGVAFPVSPTVHSDSLATIFENGAVIADMIRAAATISGSDDIAISPLAWTYPAQATYRADPAIVGLWALAALLSAGRAGAHSISLGADVAEGLTSVMAMGEAALSLHHLSGSMILPLELVHPSVSFLALQTSDGAKVIFAVNLSRELCEIRLPPTIQLAGAGRDRTPTQQIGSLLSLPASSALVTEITWPQSACAQAPSPGGSK